jgi:hypothetical protein
MGRGVLDARQDGREPEYSGAAVSEWPAKLRLSIGRGSRIRTCGPLLPREGSTKQFTTFLTIPSLFWALHSNCLPAV